MNVWEPYRKTVRDQVPDADEKTVFDKFDVLQDVSAAVDQVRKQEGKQLAAVGGPRPSAS